MSRSQRGQKGAGYEYWTRRAWGPGKHLSLPGCATKTLTHRHERRESQGVLAEGVVETVAELEAYKDLLDVVEQASGWRLPGPNVVAIESRRLEI